MLTIKLRRPEHQKNSLLVCHVLAQFLVFAGFTVSFAFCFHSFSLLVDTRLIYSSCSLYLPPQQLPPSSSYSGLEELRAAHNLISQVPASLSKNAALRTLDLGHNRIDKWIGLERLGKSLKSLMQLSLAGNPLCGPPTAAAAASEDKGEEGEGEEGEGEGEYVAKVKSLFPGLKVRDGKRILMKKSHTYYETRGGEEGGGAAKDASGPGGRGKPGHPAAVGGRAGLDAKSDGAGRRKVEEGEKEKGAKSPKSKGVRVGGGAQIVEEEGGDEQESKAARKMKRKAARAAAAELVAEAERKAELAALGKPDKKGAKKRRREAEEGKERRSRSPVDVSSDDADKSKKKQRRPSEGAAADSVVETAAASDGTPAAPKQKASKTKKKKKTKHASSVGGSGGQPQEDPYSSSEELPIPGRRETKSAAAAAVPVGGDRESGVVSVVINKKRKGAVGGAAQARQGGAAPGHAEDGGRFSFDAILAARGEKETIGSGSGVSAWDT